MQGLKSQSPRSVLWTWCHIAIAMCTCNVIDVDIRTGFGTILWSVTWWILSIHFTEEMKRKKCEGKKIFSKFQSEEFANPEDQSPTFTSVYTAQCFLMVEWTPKLPVATRQGCFLCCYKIRAAVELLNFLYFCHGKGRIPGLNADCVGLTTHKDLHFWVPLSTISTI